MPLLLFTTPAEVNISPRRAKCALAALFLVLVGGFNFLGERQKEKKGGFRSEERKGRGGRGRGGQSREGLLLLRKTAQAEFASGRPLPF